MMCAREFTGGCGPLERHHYVLLEGSQQVRKSARKVCIAPLAERVDHSSHGHNIRGQVREVRCQGRPVDAGQEGIRSNRVEGLGRFLELELVLRPHQSELEGRRVASRMMAEFGISGEQLTSHSYFDMLTAPTPGA